jgi:hypothetical protein
LREEYRLNSIGLLTGLALWIFLLWRRHSRSSGFASDGWLEAAAGLVIAVSLWWAYVKARSPL